jgi:superfamily II DNA or RNA helicase
MQSLFEAVRDACDKAIWSRGVLLARDNSVVGESSSREEIVLHVSTRGGLVAPQVHLFPADQQWECNCDSSDDPCDHVAAAVIALRQAQAAGRSLPGNAESSGRVGYRFRREKGGLHFERCIVTPRGEQTLQGSLAAIASGRVDGPSFAAQPADLRVEEKLGTRSSGVFPREAMPRLLAALTECSDVRVEGEAVAISSDPVLPCAIVEDRGEGFAVELRPSSEVDEVFANGVALCRGELRPLGEARLSLREREQLVGGRYFAPEQVALLLSEVLPSLRTRIPVEVRTSRLPSSERTPPRLLVEVERTGDTLSVRPSLVYGDPPMARVEDGRLIDVEGSVPVRDLRAEENLIAKLRRELQLTPSAAISFAAEEAIELADRLRNWDGVIRGGAHEGFFRTAELVPELDVSGNDFTLGFRTARGGRVDSGAVMAAWQAGQSLVPLLDSGFAPLPRDWLQRFGARVADLLAAKGSREELPTHTLPDLARLCRDLDLPSPPGFERLKLLVDDFDRIPDAVPPADLDAELRPYQLRGVSWLVFLREAGLGGLLADDMGLGKTIQALCAMRGRTLVVAPTSVLHSWTEQANRFRPDLRISVYHGSRRELDTEADLTLTTYAVLRIDAELLSSVRWETAVLDEAQMIKNPDSQVARAAYRLDADVRMTLTGTPVENRLDELWSQFAFLNPGLLGGRKDFQTRYARPIADGEPGAAAHLRERIAPFILRRLKADVAPELPPRTEVVLHCELSEDERAVYDAVRAATQASVTEKLRAGGSTIEALEALLRLRQASCHTALVPGQSASSSSKLALLVETLDEVVAEGHKALVFSQWTGLLDLIEPELREANLSFTRLDGSTVNRGAVVSYFQDTDGPPVMLISLRAGGTGLNLTEADHVFLVDPWWNPAVEDQAADRAHRIGQERPVLIHRLVARNTVEERILALQAQKRAVAGAALSGADRASSISREELLALLD